jgi:hypothetical protein
MTTLSNIEKATQLLEDVGMARAQLNERSALCLLALVAVGPNDEWDNASNPLMGITPIMDWCRDVYGTTYAPNTRETFRRQSMHQFVEAGIALYNPDEPSRPVNSPKAVYQVAPEFLELVRTFDTDYWNQNVIEYLDTRIQLIEKYEKAREQAKIPVEVREDLSLKLSPGKHSELIRDIIEDFAPRFAPGSKLVYVGDTGDKYVYYDKELLATLDVELDDHGKMPDVILYQPKKNWLFLVESVTSHGPVDAKRYGEFMALFGSASAELVFITALPTRNLMAKFLTDIAWETEVWVSESPSHLIHFNGDKFLGPYE